MSGEGVDSDSDFDGCVFDNDQALSSGGAVVVEGAIDPDTAEPTTARFHDCVFTRAWIGGQHVCVIRWIEQLLTLTATAQQTTRLCKAARSMLRPPSRVAPVSSWKGALN